MAMVHGQSEETISPQPGDVVLDTSVLMDCMFAERPRHGRAQDLVAWLAQTRRRVFIPAHSYFELMSAILCEYRRLQKPLTLGKAGAALPFEFFVVTIGLAFVSEYLLTLTGSGKVVDLKGGDMIFAALALRHGLPLITEDARLAKVTRSHGGDACDVDEYLKR